MKSKILVTGGAGFIGSHTAKLLRKSGFEPVVYDNLVTGHSTSVRWGPLVVGDINDTALLTETMLKHEVEAVIHFAAFAYVGESVQEPAKYYHNNVAGTLSLLNACRAAGVNKLIFSSSCATYGVPTALPISESLLQQPINPYGQTKLIGEKMLADFGSAYGLRFAALRYFNACGADLDGELGEWHEPETHLVPRALMAAAGTIPHLDVFGADYPTPDGSCIRDYIHVCDLADAHIKALNYLNNGGKSLVVNLGGETPTSVFEVLNAIERVTGKKVPVSLQPRRAGDPHALYADASLAREKLGFSPLFSDIDTIIKTAAPHFGLEIGNAAAA